MVWLRWLQTVLSPLSTLRKQNTAILSRMREELKQLLLSTRWVLMVLPLCRQTMSASARTRTTQL